MKTIPSETIPIEHFNCPKCGAKGENGDFYIDGEELADDSYFANETVMCNICGYTKSFGALVNQYNKKQNLVKCSCCNGTGYIKGTK